MQSKKGRGKARGTDADPTKVSNDKINDGSEKKLIMTLTALDWEDIKVLRQWRNDPAAFRYFRQDDFINDVQQAAWFEGISKETTHRMYKIQGNDGEKAGMLAAVGLTSVDERNRRAEVSIVIDPANRGTGLGKIAIYLLCQHAFNNVLGGLHQVYAEVLETNESGNALFEAMGFQKTGVKRDFYRKEGRYEHAFFYQMGADVWAGLQSKLADTLV